MRRTLALREPGSRTVLEPDEVLDGPRRPLLRGVARARAVQRWFAYTDAKIAVLTGGYRSGKTVAAVLRAYVQGQRHYGWPVLVMEPKWRMVYDVFVRTALHVCKLWRLRCAWYETKKLLEIGPEWHPSRLLFRSNDAGRDAAEGITAGSAVIDEWELFDVEVLNAAFARVSAGPAQYQTIGLCGTAEGYGPGYSLILDKPASGTEVRIARTVDNQRYLRAGYADDQAARLSEAEAKEKLDGIRAPAGGVVYTRFRRGVHDAKPCVDERHLRSGSDRVFVAVFADFNVGLMAWPLALVDKTARAIHIFAECVHFDTSTPEQSDRVIMQLQVELQRILGRPVERGEIPRMKIPIICDASSDARTGIVALSHVSVLRERGFVPKYGTINPAVEDRVACLQNLLGGPLPSGAQAAVRLTVDRERAPYTTMCLEQQPKLPNGEPSKASNSGQFNKRPVGLDHGAEAVGYGAFWYFPTWRPAPNLEEEQKKKRYRAAGFSNIH